MTSSKNKDLPLKFLLKAYLRRIGYVPEIELQISARQYQTQYKREQLSDFDIVAFAIEGDFYVRLIAAECKSGNDHALDELLKLKGVLDATGVDRGYFIKSRIHQNARLAARKLRITCLDEQELRALLQGWVNDIDEILEQEDRVYDRRRGYESDIREAMPRLHDYLRYEYWNLESWRNVHNILYLLRNTSEKNSVKIELAPHRFLLLRVLHLFSLTLMRLCSSIYSAGLSDPIRSLQLELYGGPRERRDREVLQDTVNRALAERGREPIRLDADWESDLAEVVVRLLRSAHVATRIPYLTAKLGEQALMDGVAGMPVDWEKSFDVVTIKLAQDVARMLCRASGVLEEGYADLMKL